MKVKFGICADLHCEFIHDSVYRIKTFLNDAKKHKVDFCVQLGDFCPPGDINLEHKRQIFELIKNCGIPFYHLLGNHDMDKNEKQAVLDFINLENAYYSFDAGDVHFVCLDPCFYKKGESEISYNCGNYAKNECDSISILPQRQLEWLKTDLSDAKYPVVFFSHQSLVESRTSIGNAPEFRDIIKKSGCNAVAAFCGHEHVDRAEKKENMWYYCVNGMSYYWCGSKYAHSSYGEKFEKMYPKLKCVFSYKDPLYAIVDIDDERIEILGRESEFVGMTPKDINFTKKGLVDEITPSIQNRKFIL